MTAKNKERFRFFDGLFMDILISAAIYALLFIIIYILFIIVLPPVKGIDFT